MPEFKSYRSYLDFTHAVKRERRYIMDDVSKEFLEAVTETAEKRTTNLFQTTFLWRAQRGHGWRSYEEDGEVEEIPSAFPPERMVPLLDRALEGRANAKGIPYLYLGSTSDTAMAEVRPGVGSMISLAQFRTERKLDVVNCAGDQQPFKVYFDEPSPEVRESEVWSDINRAFSEPVIPNESLADYAPTQIIAELFRSMGKDGIVFKSSLGSGHNVVLFDRKAATLINCSLHEAKSVQFQFAQVDGPYFVHPKLNSGPAA